MRGELTLTLTTRSGAVLAVRRAKNSVMRSGAELVARLFSGQGAGITHMVVGTNDAPESDAYTTAALDPGQGDAALGGGTEAPIPAEAFTIAVDAARRMVRVRVRGTLPAPAAVGTVREAGLLSRTPTGATLYNRVTFAPITKGDDHELTLFWEVSFPYGDLPY